MAFDFSRFNLDLDKGCLAAQLASKIEDAVRRGRLRPGDRLPTRVQWADALGVSEFVPRRAMDMLAHRGVIAMRRHVGASVSGRFARSQKKKVVYLSVDRGNIWARSVFSFRLGDEIRKSGFRYEHVILPSMREQRRFGPPDVSCSVLDDVLSDGVDFVWVESSASWITRPLIEADVPFAVYDFGGDSYPGAEIVIHIDGTKIAKTLVERFRSANVASVALVGPGPEVDDFLSAHLYATGIRFQKIPVNLSGRANMPEEWQRQSLRRFEKLFLNGHKWMPDAFVFIDDYIAAGALLAMARNGVEAPRDVKVVVFSNKGLGPVYFRPLSRIENAPERKAVEVARYIIGRLKGNSPCMPDIAYRFIPGSTL